MSESLSAAGAALWTEGTWTGVVTPHGSLLLPPDVPHGVVNQFWERLHRSASNLTEVLDLLVVGAGGQLARIPDFALVVMTSRGVHAALRGRPTLEINAERYEAGPVATWREIRVEEAATILLEAPEKAGGVRRPVIDAVLCLSRLELQGAPSAPPWASPTTAARRSRVTRSAVSPAWSASSFPGDGASASSGWVASSPPLGRATSVGSSDGQAASASSASAPLAGHSSQIPLARDPGPSRFGGWEALVVPSEPGRPDRGSFDGDPVEHRPGDEASSGGASDAADSVEVLEPDLVPSPLGAAPSSLSPEPDDRPGDHDGWTLAGLPDELVGEFSPALADGVTDATLPSQSLLTDRPGRGEARMALSVICAQGHANPTNYVSCRSCGVELSQPARMIACPSLGRLAVSSGGCVELDRPVLVGRMPDPLEVPQLVGVTPSIVRVSSPEYLISRNHLLIELEEWSVLARSLSSSNGTTLRRPGAAPMRLTSAETVLLASGDVLDLGEGQTLLLEDLP